MHAAAADRAEFAPPPPPGQLRALGLAVFAHVLLLGALTWGVNWKRSDTALTVEAELWSAVPRQAAPRLQAPPPVVAPPPAPVPKPAPIPRPAPPPPAPPDVTQRNADIALARQKQQAEALAARQKLEIEQKKRQRLEKEEAEKRELAKKRLAQEQLEREKLKKAADEKKAQEKQLALEAQRKEALKLEAKKKEDEARAEMELKAQRDANIRRMTGMANATGGKNATGSATQSAGPSAGYAGKVAARVKPNIVFADDIAGNPSAEVEVRAAPDGTILSRKPVKSSGVKAWDDAVLKAIDKTEKLPIDTDGRVPPSLIISFRPKD